MLQIPHTPACAPFFASRHSFRLLLSTSTGLDSLHIPKNGDEYPYMHITRLTAASGKLLPLQSEMEHMRNTKPPCCSGKGLPQPDGERIGPSGIYGYPSVIYTILTAMLTLLMARKISGPDRNRGDGCPCFPRIFQHFRYGRPFLTDPALVFWLLLPFFTLIYWRPASFESRFRRADSRWPRTRHRPSIQIFCPAHPGLSRHKLVVPLSPRLLSQDLPGPRHLEDCLELPYSR